MNSIMIRAKKAPTCIHILGQGLVNRLHSEGRAAVHAIEAANQLMNEGKHADAHTLLIGFLDDIRSDGMCRNCGGKHETSSPVCAYKELEQEDI